MGVLNDMKQSRQVRPIYSLAFVVLVVGVITGISFSSFWYSDTKDLVKTIQASSRGSLDYQPTASTIDDDGNLTSAELQLIIDGVLAESEKLNPEADFGSAQLDSSALGL